MTIHRQGKALRGTLAATAMAVLASIGISSCSVVGNPFEFHDPDEVSKRSQSYINTDTIQPPQVRAPNDPAWIRVPVVESIDKEVYLDNTSVSSPQDYIKVYTFNTRQAGYDNIIFEAVNCKKKSFISLYFFDAINGRWIKSMGGKWSALDDRYGGYHEARDLIRREICDIHWRNGKRSFTPKGGRW